MNKIKRLMGMGHVNLSMSCQQSSMRDFFRVEIRDNRWTWIYTHS